ncbi:hypothetical protein AAFF_G00043400 [Aldrovandia affinis]|uniref:Uncharacterized protein n=1 Tax=Aldrovandia affinis TaxID=143900 RepID=A0AAD7WFJ4_9TELE|nr:hypothetical protein AAFF_G00043400 [Aldrovandia affinis]
MLTPCNNSGRWAPEVTLTGLKPLLWALLQWWCSSERKMALMREYFWLLLVLGMVFVSTLIGLLFLFINKCISRRADNYKTNSQQNASHEFYTDSQYHPKQLEEDLPPLPPRNSPILPSCPKSASYEEMAPLPNYVKVDEKIAPPPYQSCAIPVPEVCPDNYSVSTEGYDDVVQPGYESEDYDDIA